MIRKKSPFDGWLLALYLMGYGIARFIVEFFREPDPQIGLIGGILSLGQILCLAMVFFGYFLYRWRRSRILLSGGR